MTSKPFAAARHTRARRAGTFHVYVDGDASWLTVDAAVHEAGFTFLVDVCSGFYQRLTHLDGDAAARVQRVFCAGADWYEEPCRAEVVAHAPAGAMVRLRPIGPALALPHELGAVPRT